MAQNIELGRQQVVLPIGSPAATSTLPGMQIPGSMVLRNAWLIDQATLAAGDTNYYVAELKKNGTAIASWSTKLTGGNGPSAANVPLPMINSATGLAFAGEVVQLVATDVLTVVVTKNGTGVPTLATMQLSIHGN